MKCHASIGRFFISFYDCPLDLSKKDNFLFPHAFSIGFDPGDSSRGSGAKYTLRSRICLEKITHFCNKRPKIQVVCWLGYRALASDLGALGLGRGLYEFPDLATSHAIGAPSITLTRGNSFTLPLFSTMSKGYSGSMVVVCSNLSCISGTAIVVWVYYWDGALSPDLCWVQL